MRGAVSECGETSTTPPKTLLFGLWTFGKTKEALKKVKEVGDKNVSKKNGGGH